MFCAISGEPPTTPVVSKKSGLIYEQRLILKYIAENAKDPVTGEELSEDDLIEIAKGGNSNHIAVQGDTVQLRLAHILTIRFITSLRRISDPRTAIPRPPTLSSVPALLTSLQNEYDAVMLELFQFKKQYDTMRQELATALYYNDSANRVVARLMYERDEARSALASIKDSLGQNGSIPVAAEGDAEMTDGAAQAGGIPPSASAKIEAAAKRLFETRKAKLKRRPEGYPRSAEVGRFAQSDALTSMHGTKPPGVTALDISYDSNFLLTGGRDKQVQVFDRTTGKIAATLKGHTKDITRVAFLQSSVDVEFGAISAGNAGTPPAWAVSASADSSIRVWKAIAEGKNAFALAHTINDFKDSITGLVSHPCGDLFLAASADGSWALYDAATGTRLQHVETEQSFVSLDSHPDGNLLAVGTNASSIIIYELKSGNQSATFNFEQEGPASVSSLSFSENGFYLAGATATTVEVWDLRKLVRAGTIAVDGDGSVTTTVRFDPSAQFLAVAGAGVSIYANKTWERLWKADEAHSAAVTDARWNWASGTLLTAGLDRAVRTFATSAQAAE